MQRFYIEKEQLNQDTISIVGADYKHITKVLRHNIGDELYVAYDGMDYICDINDITDKEVVLSIKEVKPNDTEPKVYVHLYQGLPKQDKLELIIQKCVELGISEITPVETKFCISKINKKAKDKTERLQKISASASYQCGRGIIPKVNEPTTFNKLSHELFSDALNIVAYEKEDKATLKTVLQCNDNISKINIFVGSEGGIAEEEIQKLQQNGFSTITLGKRILRTETAPITLLSNIMYELDM